MTKISCGMVSSHADQLAHRKSHVSDYPNGSVGKPFVPEGAGDEVVEVG